MYKYFKELDNPDNYSIYLNTPKYNKDNIHYFTDVFLNNLPINSNTFEDIKIIDQFVIGMKNILGSKNLSFNEFELYYDFLNYCNENYEYVQFLKSQINLTYADLKNIFDTYLDLSERLLDFFPNYQIKFNKISKELAEIINEMNIRSTIVIPESNNDNKHKFPNAWFITPDGYLYNMGGENGHKEGNLIYPFDFVIKPQLLKNKKVPELNTLKQIKNILSKGYVTQSEFRHYANLIAELPTILTPEVELDEMRYNNVLNLPEDEYLKIKNEDFPNPKRSYQKNIITLVTGHLSAESALFKSFSKLNDSKNKCDNISKLESLTNSYIPDILVRYSGFCKIESQIARTITSSSLYSIDMLKNYLDKGWNLQLIPGIIYDTVLDKVVEVDFNSYYIQKFLDKKLNSYSGKGNILIK